MVRHIQRDLPGDDLEFTLSRLVRKSGKMNNGFQPVPPQSNYLDGFYKSTSPSTIPRTIWIRDLARLRNEQDILENGLATCVTYLLALRKKQARNERLLHLEPSPPRKKRKKIEQSKRALERKIRNRQRDEQAFLSNLQACKANIYVAEGHVYTPVDLIPTTADCTSSTTQLSCGDSAPTEISWSGWTEGAMMSPFEKKRSNPFVVNDVAPDEFVTKQDRDSVAIRMLRPLPLIRDAEEFDILPVTLNFAHSQYRHSSLSAEAAVFKPSRGSARQDDESTRLPPETFENENTSQTRRSTEAGIVRSFRNLSIQTDRCCSQARYQTCCNTTPQRSPGKDTSNGAGRRRRSNSL